MADQCRSCQLSFQGVQWFERSPKHGGLFRCLKQLDPHVNGTSETPVCHLVFCLKAGHGLSWHLAGFISKSRRFTMFRRQFIDVYNLKAKDPWGNCSCTTRSWDFRQSWPMQKKTVSRKVARINEPNHKSCTNIGRRINTYQYQIKAHDSKRWDSRIEVYWTAFLKKPGWAQRNTGPKWTKSVKQCFPHQ